MYYMLFHLHIKFFNIFEQFNENMQTLMYLNCLMKYADFPLFIQFNAHFHYEMT